MHCGNWSLRVVLLAMCLLVSLPLTVGAQQSGKDNELIIDRVNQAIDVLSLSPVERMTVILEERVSLIEEGESELESKELREFLKKTLGARYYQVKDENYALNLDWAFLSSVLEDYSKDPNEQNKLLSDYIVAKWNLWNSADIAFYTMLARLLIRSGKTQKLADLLDKFDPKTGGRTFFQAITGKGGDPYANIRRARLVELYRIGIEHIAKQGSQKRLIQWVDNMAKWDAEGKVVVKRVEIPADMFYTGMPGTTHRLKASTLNALLKYKLDGDKEVLSVLTRDVADLLETMLRRGQFDVASDELLYFNKIRTEMNMASKPELQELYITLLPINTTNRQIANERERKDRERIILWDKKREELFSKYPELQYMDQFLEELNYPEFFQEKEGVPVGQRVDDTKRVPGFEQNKVMIYLLTAIMHELEEGQ